MQFGVDDGNALVVRLKIEEVRVRIIAAVQQKGDLAVVGVL